MRCLPYSSRWCKVVRISKYNIITIICFVIFFMTFSAAVYSDSQYSTHSTNEDHTTNEDDISLSAIKVSKLNLQDANKSLLGVQYHFVFKSTQPLDKEDILIRIKFEGKAAKLSQISQGDYKLQKMGEGFFYLNLPDIYGDHLEQEDVDYLVNNTNEISIMLIKNNEILKKLK